MTRTLSYLLVCLLACLSLCLARGVAAQPLNGEYELAIGGDNEVWYAQGDDVFSDNDNGDTAEVRTTGAVTSATGEVTATGMLSFHFVNLIDMDLPLTFVGQMTGTTKKSKIKVAYAGSGIATLQDDQLGAFDAPTTASGSINCKHPSPHATEFECSGRLKLCFIEPISGRRFCSRGPMLALFGAAGGPWTLHLSVATDGERAVTGTATTTLGNGASQSHSVTGKYSTKSDTSSLKVRTTVLKGKDKVSASKLAESLDAGKLTFKVAGQTGKLTLVPAP